MFVYSTLVVIAFSAVAFRIITRPINHKRAMKMMIEYINTVFSLLFVIERIKNTDEKIKTILMHCKIVATPLLQHVIVYPLIRP